MRQRCWRRSRLDEVVVKRQVERHRHEDHAHHAFPSGQRSVLLEVVTAPSPVGPAHRSIRWSKQGQCEDIVYIPAENSESDPDVLYNYIDENPFGILITNAPAPGLVATHLPLLLDRRVAPHGMLTGHIARRNQQHRVARNGDEALAVFSRHEAYVRPGWYESKQQHGRVVPTWNYVAVHVYGRVRFIDDRAFVREQVERLTSFMEQHRTAPWKVEDAPPEYLRRLEGAIVGIEFAITRLEGSWKLSQDRSDGDVRGVVQGLQASGTPGDRDVANVMRSRLNL